jgi:hypothetical protein
MPLIKRQLLDRRQDPEAIFFNAMDKSASAATDRTVANSNMIEIGIDFELHFPAVTRPFVRLLHDAPIQLRFCAPSNEADCMLTILGLQGKIDRFRRDIFRSVAGIGLTRAVRRSHCRGRDPRRRRRQVMAHDAR